MLELCEQCSKAGWVDGLGGHTSHYVGDYEKQWIGLREILQENTIFNETIYGFL